MNIGIKILSFRNRTNFNKMSVNDIILQIKEHKMSINNDIPTKKDISNSYIQYKHSFYN